ncbi:iron permease FTR1 family protein [Rhodococcus sp. MTM3W5.2]|nr:iron permease FTR1 family protein [Rhodococcus sp. MTM3W5.2]
MARRRRCRRHGRDHLRRHPFRHLDGHRTRCRAHQRARVPGRRGHRDRDDPVDAQGRGLDLRAPARGLSKALAVGPFAVASMAFFAVGREGVETALLLVGYAENTAGSIWPLVGLLLGIAVAAALTVALYFGAVRINFAAFFRYTGVFLVVVAAGILAYGVRALQIAGWLPGGSNLAFDVSAHFDTSTWYGTVLQGIFNFRPDPTVLQVVAWAVYLVVVLTLFLRPLPAKPGPERAPLPEPSNIPAS